METEKKNNNVLIGGVVVVLVLVIGIFAIMNNKDGSVAVDTPGQNNNTMAQEVSLVDGGVKYLVLQEGQGEPVVSGKKVSMHYEGRLVDGRVFDSTLDPSFGHPETLNFDLGSGQVIQGWDLGIEGMKVGEKRLLTIAPEYAYGDRAVGDVIPANSTLVFEVELVSFN